MERQGWIKLHRKLLDWEWYKDSQSFHLFCHFLLSANHTSGKWQGIEVKRGQFISGINSLSAQTGIKPQSLRTIIKRLKSTGELTSQSTNKFTLYTIVNYDNYQSSDSELTSKSTSQLTNNQQATNKQLTTNKNDKNEKNGKNTEQAVAHEAPPLPDKITFEFETIAMNLKLNLEQTKEQYELFKNYYLARPDERIKTYAPLWKNWCIKAFGNYQANRGDNSRNYGRAKQENKPKARDINDPEYIAELKAMGAIV